MSLPKHTQAKAAVAPAPRDNKAAAGLDDASIPGSADHKINETPTLSAIIATEATENPEVSPCRRCSGGNASLTIITQVLPQTANEHQSETISEHAIETTSLAEHLTQLEVKDKDDGHDILNSIIQLASITEETGCKQVDMLPNSGILSKEGRRVRQESLEAEITASSGSSRYACP